MYLSSEIGYIKAAGHLYEHIAKDLGLSPAHILHIGDNETADVRRAKEQGFRALLLPKCTVLLMNAVSGSYSGEIFQKAYGESFLHRYQAPKDFLGLRTMLAVAAMRLFDNPFRPIGEDSDLNGEPSLLGYGVLGMHLFAIADWLHREMKQGNFDRLCFMARDGYLPRQAYDVLRRIYPEAPESEYVHFTRSSILPLRIRREADWWALSRGVVPTAKSPKDIVEWFEDFLSEEERKEAPVLCEAQGFAYAQKFASLEEWDAFIRFYKERFYHRERFSRYREDMKKVLEPLLSGKIATFDIGYHYRVDDALKQLAQSSGLGKFMRDCPEQFYNIGIAEQNMLGIASGLAKTGFKVFAATFANFITMRSCEQVRVNLGYMQLPVKLVGTRAGVVNRHLGNSHFCFEDIALMRAIPNLVVVSPADAFEAVKTVEAAVACDRPMYIRLTGKVNTPMVYKADYDFEIGKAVVLREGTDAAIFTAGTLAANALKAAKALEEKGISAAVINMHTIKPLDREVLDRFAVSSRLWVSLEEHSIVGGLGSAIAEYKATLKSAPPQIFLGLPDAYGKAGSYEWLLEQYGLTDKGIAESIEKALK